MIIIVMDFSGPIESESALNIFRHVTKLRILISHSQKHPTVTIYVSKYCIQLSHS